VYRCHQRSRRRSACGLHLRRSSASWLNAQVYYTFVDCNPLTLLLRFALDLSYKLFLYCYAAVGKNSTDTSRRAARLQQQSVLSSHLLILLTNRETDKQTEVSAGEDNSDYLLPASYLLYLQHLPSGYIVLHRGINGTHLIDFSKCYMLCGFN